MARISKYIMSIALLLMLFQIFAPVFLPIVQQVSNTKTTTIQVQHNSVVAPLYLKEKDEKEHVGFSTLSDVAALLDFTVHNVNLTASHKGKPNYFRQDIWYDPAPPLYTCLGIFLI